MRFIVAIDEKNGISRNGQIPWYYPEDFKFFKEKTLNNVCVMGFNTYLEIASMRKYPSKNLDLLPNRLCYVLSNTRKIFTNNTVKQISSINDLYEDIKNNHIHHEYDLNNLFFIGGVSIYDLALNVSDIGYITRIKKDYNCNKFFDYEKLTNNFILDSILDETDELRFEKWRVI